MYTAHRTVVTRRFLYLIFGMAAVFHSATGLAQQAAARSVQHSSKLRTAHSSYIAPINGNSLPKGATSFSSWNSSALGSASFGLFVFDHFPSGYGTGSFGWMDLPRPWYGSQLQRNPDLDGAPVMFGTFYDPFKTFEGNGFTATSFGWLPQLNNVLRGGPGSYPDALWMGTTADTEWTKQGSNFEASMTAQFIWSKQTRYPVTVTFPAYMQFGDEQYLLGPRYGYVTAGINLRMPLSFIPSRYGRWSAGSSADLCYYGENMREFVKSIGPQVPRMALALNVDF